MKNLITALVLVIPCLTYAAPPADYSDPNLWLCHPDDTSFCAQEQSSTTVTADGKLTVEPFVPASNPDVDCFYVYPTVSEDKSGNSDFVPNYEEARVIQAQFARFGAACRTYAPIYRQITLTALRSGIYGEQMPVDRELAYADVKAAWEHYLAHNNSGRGVILVGHSQGTGLLTELIRKEIDGQPIQQQVISAYLIGSSGVLNPPGADVGGTFKHMPLCRRDSQTQCIVSFATFRENRPPPADSLFGQARDPSQRHLEAACNLPGALSGGPARLSAYLSAGGESLASSNIQAPWTTAKPQITTPFVTVPGLLQGECVRRGGFHYLAVKVLADESDPRADEIAGDVIINEQIADNWGLHLIDMHLTIGNLISLAQSQTRAYLAR